VTRAITYGGNMAYSWNTSIAPTSSHTIQAVARDAAYNTSSTSVAVVVTR
jgi:hypothetical protein